jgi:hypothetical protein
VQGVPSGLYVGEGVGDAVGMFVSPGLVGVGVGDAMAAQSKPIRDARAEDGVGMSVITLEDRKGPGGYRDSTAAPERPSIAPWVSSSSPSEDLRTQSVPYCVPN